MRDVRASFGNREPPVKRPHQEIEDRLTIHRRGKLTTRDGALDDQLNTIAARLLERADRGFERRLASDLGMKISEYPADYAVAQYAPKREQ